jgi:hypothetical protein
MINHPTDDFEGLGLAKQQRIERWKWVFYGATAMIAVTGGLYMRESVEQRVFHAYELSVLTYGALVYVEEFDHLRKLWLWKGVLTTIPLHIAVIAALFWWDARHPELIHSGFVLVYAVWPFFAGEVVIFSLIIDHFKASASPDEPPRKLTRFLNWAKKMKPKTGKVITTLEEDGDDSDPTKESRRNYLRWGFWAASAFLLGSYLWRGVINSSVELNIIKASLLTILCYGHLLYVEEKDEIGSKWLWVTVLVTVPFHIAFFSLIVAFDRMAPYLAPNPIVFLFLIWATAWLETRVMDEIADDYRPWGTLSESVE